jgi:hypothetical protein
MGTSPGPGKAFGNVDSSIPERPAIHNGTVEITDCWAEYEQNSHHNNCYKKDDKRILDQTLPFLTWQEEHDSTSFLCTRNP